MQDFVRIGGEIVSAPLNENFRRLLNQISISNTNLIFPDQNAVVDTITDMQAIVEPDDAQSCYVVSSGELYRYTKNGEKWVKIADFGQTFRQGFLNSGAVVLEDYVKLKDGTKTVLLMPSMLVYFKNKPGDDRYLKGMYLVEAKEFDVSTLVSGANAYSITVDYTGKYSLISGLPSTDDPNNIFIGTFLVNKDKEILGDFVYTLPDIAYTADRGYFLMKGGEASGCNLVPSDTNDAKVNRNAGFYYDEGINFAKGSVDNYPIDTDNGANFDLKYYEAQTPVDKIYYMTPVNCLGNDILVSTTGLINDTYWDGSALVDVPEGYFTIQQHLVTPNGQNIIIYGTKLYNSLIDATSNINSVYGLDVSFPYIEATRIIIGNCPSFDTADPNCCVFHTLGRLSQVGTISPEFADNVFKLYSGNAGDTTPASLRFSLQHLQDEEYNNLYTLGILPSGVTRDLFGLQYKYINDDIIDEVETTQDGARSYGDISGYEIADNADVLLLKNRIQALEKEVWSPKKDNVDRWEQSIRFRLFNNEKILDEHTNTLNNHETRLTEVEQNKVNKTTTINGQALGDSANSGESKNIVLYTGDIAEGTGMGTKINEWFTQEKVSNNADVVKSVAHINTKSETDNAATHSKVNPHNLSTDDINILMNTTKIFVTPEEERRIRADRLPENTIEELAKLDEKNLDSVRITYMEGNSDRPGLGPYEVGNIKGIRFFQDGVNMSMDSDGETLVLECVGQMDENKVMLKSRYASLEAEYPDIYGGYVDNAVNATYADNVHGIEFATPNQYYGTNEANEVGLYDLPSYVTTADAGGFASIDQVVFVPVDGSVQEKHLSEDLANKINNNYHAIYNNGVLKSAEINALEFGDNLTVTIKGQVAKINASGEGGSGGASNFVNLQDVDVNYTGNEGKVIVVNEAGNGLSVAKMPALKDYMLKAVYTDEDEPTKIKRAVLADTATLAITANNSLKVNNKSVDDTKTTNAYLWTAEKIISNTTSQIQNEGVNTYSGTTVPSDTLGKNGDLYILIEG